MNAGRFWSLVAVIGLLIILGWNYLPTWPGWVAFLWAALVIGLSGYGFVAKAKEFFRDKPAANEDSQRP